MKCYACGRGLDQVALFRQNAKGQPGIWACEEHNKEAVDPEALEIVRAVEAANGISTKENRDAE